MSFLTLTISTSDSLTELESLNSEKDDLAHVINYLTSIQGGLRSAVVTLNVENTQAKTIINLTDQPTNSTTVILGSGAHATKTLLAKTAITGTTGIWFQSSTDGAVTAAQLAACVNANTGSGVYSATASASSCTIAVNAPGIVGNSITVAGTLDNATMITFGATGIALASDGTQTSISTG
jgi:hypothetical protein